MVCVQYHKLDSSSFEDMSRKDIAVKEIPDILHDLSTGKRYQKGRFLGKGGFAKCYEITDLDTKQIFAGKIVPKVGSFF